MRPPVITVRWCPECGQDDAHKTMGATVHKHRDTGEWCYGAPEEVEYRPFVPVKLTEYRHPDTVDEVVASLSPHEWEWTIIGDNNIAVWNLAKIWAKRDGEERTEREIVHEVGPVIYRRWEEEVYGPWHAEDYEEGQAA